MEIAIKSNNENPSARRNEKRKELSKWHVFRFRKMQERDDYESFVQYIKWVGGTVPIEENDDFEYLCKLREEFENLGGYEFFKSHNLDLPPCGIGGYESTFFD